MANFDPQAVITFLEANKATLWTEATTREAWLAEAKVRLQPCRSADDKKEATKLAVETAKMLLTIALAVLAVTGTLFQFAHTNGVPWFSGTTWMFALTVLLLLVSMASGFKAISGAYKRANGTLDPSGLAWDSDKHKAALGLQSYLGGLALITLIIGLVLWARADKQQSSVLSLSIPADKQSSSSSGQFSGIQSSLPSPLTIEGIWTELRLKTGGNQEIKLSASLTPITLPCK
jgi:hypothetical protein